MTFDEVLIYTFAFKLRNGIEFSKQLLFVFNTSFKLFAIANHFII